MNITLKMVMMMILMVSLSLIVTAVADYGYSDDISNCDSFKGVYINSSLGMFQCVPSNYSYVTGENEVSLYFVSKIPALSKQEVMESKIMDYQYATATTHTFILLDETIYQGVKSRSFQVINYARGYIMGLILVIIEMVKLLFYFFQMWLLAYILFVALPGAFINLRNKIATFILSRGTK